VQACGKHGIAPGVFCLGEQRARALAAQGYQYVAYDTDLNLIISSISGTQASLKA
jgi:2-keto-3-deoxy-L-rhamnonate aldolase RhmA